MAQGLDLKQWSGDKSPSMDSKSAETVKKARGVGSRRIFPPQFKLQVLDSYRNDVDCRGNQRATARKYNIHRRQIQKWLQCEQNLRTTVEDNAKNELSESKSRKKLDSEEGKTDLTLNQSAAAFARLGDAGRSKENKLENKVESVEDPKLEAQNLKRVAQKLYPSLQGNACARGEKVMHPSDGQKFYGGDVAYALRLPPSPADTRDDNFNKVIRTDDGPLDLKSKVRSEILPEEFPASNAGGPARDEHPYKLSVGLEDELRSGLGSPSENVGGQKLSNAVLKCLVQKYTGDVDGQEFFTREAEKKELLCSQTVNRAESSSLLDVQVPKKSNSVPYLPASSLKRDLDEGEEAADVASDLNLSTDGYGPDTCRKKPKTELLNRFDCSKSFNPKRRWIKESMQEMLEDAEQSQDTSSLPIKQRVKMNLRSLPEAACAPEDCSRPAGISSNFTIERLCSNETAKENDCHGWRPSFPEAYAPPRTAAEVYSFHIRPDPCRPDKGSDRFSPAEPLDLPLKEEKVSDGEDIDIDILSTTPVEKKSFDFSSYSFGKRRSFSVQFKLTVLDAFYNDKDCNKNQRATARKFNINRRQVQKWLSQESDLRSEGSIKNGKYLQRQRLGGEMREGDSCTRCPQHCLRKKEVEDPFDKTIEVNVKHCSDNECLSRRDSFNPDGAKTVLTDGLDFYGKNFFQSEDKICRTADSLLIMTPHDIARRYQDFSLVIFKEYNAMTPPRQSFLSYGINRRRVEYGNFGNEPVLVERPGNVDNSRVCEIS